MRSLQRISTVGRSELRKNLTGALLIAFFAKCGQLVVSVFLARNLQPAGFGILTFALGVGLIGGRLGTLGWPSLLVRMAPKYIRGNDGSSLVGLARAASFMVGPTALLIGVVTASVALVLGPTHKLYEALILGAFLIPIVALRGLSRNMLAALQRPQRGILVDELLPILLVIALLVVVLGKNIEPAAAVGFHFVSGGAAVLVGWYWVRHSFPADLRNCKPDYSNFWNWFLISLSSVAGISARVLMNKTDVLMLAPLGDLEDVGLYGAALRITFIQTAALTALSTVLAVMMAQAIAEERFNTAKLVFLGTLVFAIASSVPIGAVLVIFDEVVMGSLFGQSYSDAGDVLSILAMSKIAAAIVVPTSAFLLVTGRQALFSIATAASFMLNIGLNFVLIPEQGAAGAALATTISLAMMALAHLSICLLVIKSETSSRCSDIQ